MNNNFHLIYILSTCLLLQGIFRPPFIKLFILAADGRKCHVNFEKECATNKTKGMNLKKQITT
jgi:hypothetical protein